ncbi:small acid-soluble spore protein E (minor gamma-type SASP) [Seinonella peptonophila]|uniref:Small, acid-soluble spore protein gamma-type n=1 Tax=Seinonella peptonophila TaxID=112248 RepID=A0A1M4U9H1_9BACL|nr:gamma-type small acid-soluble spore protein [Seinonella peptonophila]SHE53257.1 small acid-soluble spore protein E (minor gamma-type SASP) [Seinonella peptonophila]
MAFQNKSSKAAETNVQKVRQQNQQSTQGNTANEFASEITDSQKVRQQNQQSESNKSQSIQP